jgi:hypothetical protein
VRGNDLEIGFDQIICCNDVVRHEGVGCVRDVIEAPSMMR